jgi:large subunit ribosomal protein L7Ae
LILHRFQAKSIAQAAPAKSAAPKPAAAGKKAPKQTFHQAHAHLFHSDKKDFRIGRDLPPTRNLSRFVKWPRYVRLQRQRAILKKRLKVPPAINHFTKTLDANQGASSFTCLVYSLSVFWFFSIRIQRRPSWSLR